MSPKHYASIIASLLLLSITPAQANHEHDGYPFYGGFAIGISGADEDCDYHGYDCDGNDTSFKFYGGKRFHENLAIEVSFQDLGKLDDDQGTVTTTAESSGVNLSLLGIIPVSELGYFYGKAGVMAWETDYKRIGTTTTTTDDEGTDFTFGGGFAFSFDNQYELRLEFERLNELDDDFTPGGAYITVFSLGGTINFE